MTYVSTPVTGQTLGQTRDQVRTNTDVLRSTLAVNHIDVNLVGAGKHKFVVMPEQTVNPTTLTDEGAVYTKDASAATQLFYRQENNGQVYQLTRAIDASFAKFSTNTALPGGNGNGGWTFLPGGLLFQYGSFNPNTSVAIQFSIPFTSPPLSITLTQSIDNNSTFRQGAISSGTLSNTGFTYQGSVSSHINPVYFMAIGV